MGKKNARAKGKQKARAAAAPGAFAVGQRVKVTREGSYALGCAGVVDLVERDKVFVMLDHKQAAAAFPADHLAAE